MPDIHEVATLTSKGQLTLPKTIRQALGVDIGGKIAFDLKDNGDVIVSRAHEGHSDPAIGAFLILLEADIQNGRALQSLPEPLARALREAADSADDGDKNIDGDVTL